METVNINVAITHNDSSSRNELNRAKVETANREASVIIANGTNTNLTRIPISARARWREGAADIIVKIVKMIEATTKDISKSESFDNIGLTSCIDIFKACVVSMK